MKMTIITSLLVISSLMAICPFGDSAYVGNNYALKRYNYSDNSFYLHPFVDIFMPVTQPVVALQSGKARFAMSSINQDAGDYDFELLIDEIAYCHLNIKSIPKNLSLEIASNSFAEVEEGDTLGFLTSTESGAVDNWTPHLELGVVGEYDSLNPKWEYNSIVNPLLVLDSLGYGCDCIKESILTKESDVHLTSLSGNFSYYEGTPVLRDSVCVQGCFDFQAYIDSGKTRATAPYEMRWGVDNDTLGSFIVNGNLPRSPSEQSGVLDLLYSGSDWRLSYLSGSTGDTADINDCNSGYWNTRQSTEDSIYAWNDTTNDKCDNDTRKFPDGEYKLWVWARTYCDTIGKADTVKVIIDNNPPQVDTISKGSAYVIKVEFSEPMDTSTFAGNIDIRILCRNMAQATYDSIAFNEDLTELYIYMPDTFYSDEAYHVELADNITDAAGTSLDGNANCNEDSTDNYEEIVGNGNFSFRSHAPACGTLISTLCVMFCLV